MAQRLSGDACLTLSWSVLRGNWGIEGGAGGGAVQKANTIHASSATIRVAASANTLVRISTLTEAPLSSVLDPISLPSPPRRSAASRLLEGSKISCSTVVSLRVVGHPASSN